MDKSAPQCVNSRSLCGIKIIWMYLVSVESAQYIL